MKLSKPVSLGGGFLSNSPGYTLLAIYMPLSIVTTLFFLLRAFLPISLSPALFLIISGLCAITASLYCDFMKDTKSSRFAANIRSGLIALGIAYIFISLFRLDTSWDKRFLPGDSNILASLGTLYIWVSVVSMKQLFSACKLLEEYTIQYQGELLRKTLYEEAGLLQDTGTGIDKAKNRYLIQLIFICIIALGCVFSGTTLAAALYFLLIIILAGGACVLGFFGIARWEHACAAEGLPLSAYNRTKRILGMGIFSALSVIAAIVLSSDKSILPHTLITDFFAWLAGLLRINLSLTAEPEAPGFDASVLLPGIEPVFLEEIEDIPAPWPFFVWLKYGLIILALAGFILFMIYPLLNRGRSSKGKLPFRQRLGLIIAELFKGILSTLIYVFGLIKNHRIGRRLRKPGAEELRRAAGALLGAYSQAKRSDMKRSVTLFARLIIWGGEVWQVMWEPFHAPGEYCGLLVASIQKKLQEADANAKEPASAEIWSLSEAGQLSEAIIYCGELFEKALYSADVLSDDERGEFKDMVEKITSKGF